MSVLCNRLYKNFTDIPKELISDTSISVMARFIYIVLASRPKGMPVKNVDVKAATRIKSDSVIAKYWKELLNAGWIKREKITPDSLSRCGYYEYEIVESLKD